MTLTQHNYSLYLDEPETGENYKKDQCPCCDSQGAWNVGFGEIVCNECNRQYFVAEYNKYLDSLPYLYDYDFDEDTERYVEFAM